MSVKNKLVTIAGSVAIVACIAGLSAYSSWDKDLKLSQETVSSGNLEANLLAYSATEASNSDQIDLAVYQVSQGDSIQISIPVDMALNGNNLAASLSFDNLDENIVIPEAVDYVKINTSVVDSDTSEELPLNDEGLYVFQTTERASTGAEGITVDSKVLDKVPEANAVININFDENIPEYILAEDIIVTFDESSIVFEQYR